MAAFIQKQLEDKIPQYHHLRFNEILSIDEIKKIANHRRTFEHQLLKSNPDKEDCLKYLQYEVALHHLITLRYKNASKVNKLLKKEKRQTLSDLHRLFHRILRYFPNDISFRLQYIDFCLSSGSSRLLWKSILHSLRYLPKVELFWCIGSDRALQIGNLKMARIFLRRGIQMNGDSLSIWKSYLKLEGITLYRNGKSLLKSQNIKGELDKDENGVEVSELDIIVLAVIIEKGCEKLRSNPKRVIAFLFNAMHLIYQFMKTDVWKIYKNREYLMECIVKKWREITDSLEIANTFLWKLQLLYALSNKEETKHFYWLMPARLNKDRKNNSELYDVFDDIIKQCFQKPTLLGIFSCFLDCICNSRKMNKMKHTPGNTRVFREAGDEYQMNFFIDLGNVENEGANPTEDVEDNIMKPEIFLNESFEFAAIEESILNWLPSKSGTEVYAEFFDSIFFEGSYYYYPQKLRENDNTITKEEENGVLLASLLYNNEDDSQALRIVDDQTQEQQLLALWSAISSASVEDTNYGSPSSLTSVLSRLLNLIKSVDLEENQKAINGWLSLICTCLGLAACISKECSETTLEECLATIGLAMKRVCTSKMICLYYGICCAKNAAFGGSANELKNLLKIGNTFKLDEVDGLFILKMIHSTFAKLHKYSGDNLLKEIEESQVEMEQCYHWLIAAAQPRQIHCIVYFYLNCWRTLCFANNMGEELQNDSIFYQQIRYCCSPHRFLHLPQYNRFLVCISAYSYGIAIYEKYFLQHIYSNGRNAENVIKKHQQESIQRILNVLMQSYKQALELILDFRKSSAMNSSHSGYVEHLVCAIWEKYIKFQCRMESIDSARELLTIAGYECSDELIQQALLHVSNPAQLTSNIMAWKYHSSR